MGSALPEALLQMAIVRRILDGIHQGNLLLSGIYDGKGQDGVSHVEICSSIVNAVGPGIYIGQTKAATYVTLSHSIAVTTTVSFVLKLLTKKLSARVGHCP